jgi:pimeloyl-ACP methyl ester carboxylesterase
MKLILVHGRAQNGKNPAELRALWESTLARGLDAAGAKLPVDTTVVLPFYGDELDKLVQDVNSPMIADVATKGSGIGDREATFRAQLANELARNAGLSTAQIEAELPAGYVQEKGPLQWGWVQAVLQALDKHKHIGAIALDQFTRDVYVYLTFPAVAKRVDAIVHAAIAGQGPCVVVGHSLGSVVAYRVLSGLAGQTDVRAFITVGSPLGLNAVRNNLPMPLATPQRVGRWRNAYDDRDVVALLPLDKTTWDITPPIDNFSGVVNQTDNSHGIEGYLNDAQVARWIADALE